jgi:8-oxo-dGTP diphosphatase
MKIHPGVGVGVILLKENKVLLGKRKGSHGDGSWAFAGGHLEFKEDLEECAKREALEETSLHVKNIRFATLTNDIFENENKHYVTIFMTCDYDSGELKIMEPDKCEKWEWFEWGNLPEPLFIPIKNLLKQKFNPFIKNT